MTTKEKREYEFVKNMQTEIFKHTGYKVGRNDPIFPILSCISLISDRVTRDIFIRVVKSLKEFEEARQDAMSHEVGVSIRKYLGESDTKRLWLIISLCLTVGTLIGVVIGFFIGRLAA